jgi:hypothetical protein
MYWLENGRRQASGSSVHDERQRDRRGPDPARYGEMRGDDGRRRPEPEVGEAQPDLGCDESDDEPRDTRHKAPYTRPAAMPVT